MLTVTLQAGPKNRHSIYTVLYGKPLAAPIMPTMKLEVIDPKNEAAGSVGKPVPHFFPPPAPPSRIKAINYDKGGEGV